MSTFTSKNFIEPFEFACHIYDIAYLSLGNISEHSINHSLALLLVTEQKVMFLFATFKIYLHLKKNK